MSLQQSQQRIDSMVTELETAELIRETFPLMSNLCAELGRLKGQLGQVQSPQEKETIRTLMDRINNSLLQGIPEQFLIKGIERERDAIKRVLDSQPKK